MSDRTVPGHSGTPTEGWAGRQARRTHPVRPRMARFGLSLAAVVLLAVSFGGAAMAGASPTPHSRYVTGSRVSTEDRYATVSSFASPDLLAGDDGLPSSPDLPPLRYGPTSTPVDVQGNALDAHEGQYIGYFDGAYHLYGTQYGCGTHIDLSDDAPFCGFVTYRSDDLMHWRLTDRYLSKDLRRVCASYCGRPKVIFSPRLHRYLLYFSSDNGGNFGDTVPASRWLADAPTPDGPWRHLRKPTLLHGSSDSYGLTVGRDGKAYMYELTDKGGQDTEIWAERLNADYTGTSGTATLVATAPYSHVEVFQRGRYWYLTALSDARYFGPGKLLYLRAPGPTGPWRAPGGTSTTAVQLSSDTCGGSAQAVSVLPSPAGPVPVEMVDLYRSSPGDTSPRLPERARHGDWNQAIGGRYWAPLQFGPDGRIRPLSCHAATRIPLAHPVRRGHDGPPPVEQADCRVTAGGVVEQHWTVPRGKALRSLQVPVFQRARVPSPMLNPPVQPPTQVDRPLTVRLTTPTGTRHWEFRPGAVSWAPRSVDLRLRRPVPAGSTVTLRLSSTATDGCYGVLVAPVRQHGAASLDGWYAAVRNGRTVTAPGARMQFGTGPATS